MLKGEWYMKTEHTMKEISGTIWLEEKGSWSTIAKNTNMKVSLKLISLMVLEGRNGVMEPFMRANFIREWRRGRALIRRNLVSNTMAHFMIIRLIKKGKQFFKTVTNTKECGKTEWWMVMVSWNIEMEASMRVSFPTARNMERELSLTSMAIFLKATGEMESEMEKGN